MARIHGDGLTEIGPVGEGRPRPGARAGHAGGDQQPGDIAAGATSTAPSGTYLFGALGNLWGTRGRHPGWMLLALALLLLVIGIG